jgi:hypothetical protein
MDLRSPRTRGPITVGVRPEESVMKTIRIWARVPLPWLVLVLFGLVVIPRVPATNAELLMPVTSPELQVDDFDDLDNPNFKPILVGIDPNRLRISTDKAQYALGESMRFCYTVPAPGEIAIIDELPDGQRRTVLSGYDDGRGDCIAATVTPPTGRECLRIRYFLAGGGSISRQTCFQVLGTTPADGLPPGPGPTDGAPGAGLHLGTHVIESHNLEDYFVRHRSGLGVVTRIASEQDKADATFILRPALSGTPGAVSFESANTPGSFLRHQFGRLRLHRHDGSNLFKQDASFMVRPGLADADAHSFESVNFPGSFIRHRDSELWLDKNDNSTRFRGDATFWYHDPEDVY